MVRWKPAPFRTSPAAIAGSVGSVGDTVNERENRRMPLSYTRACQAPSRLGGKSATGNAAA
jgi:hypothetical protein